MKSTAGVVVTSSDGIVGHVTRFLLGLPYWTVRYFVVDSGLRWQNRKLLISPMLIGSDRPHITLSVTRELTLASPQYDGAGIVTRAEEAALLDHYALPWYWAGPSLWGPAAIARDAAECDARGRQAFSGPRWPVDDGDAVQLADSDVVFGTQVTATDGVIGPLIDVLVDIHSWRVRYLVVDISTWSLGRHALLSPSWITQRAWKSRRLTGRLSREAIARAPRCTDVAAVTRDHEIALHRYYGMPPYWETRARA